MFKHEFHIHLELKTFSTREFMATALLFFLVSGNGEEATVYTVKNELGKHAQTVSQIVPKTVPESSGKNDNKTITKTITFLTKNVLARTMFILIHFQYVPNNFFGSLPTFFSSRVLCCISHVPGCASGNATYIYIYIICIHMNYTL